MEDKNFWLPLAESLAAFFPFLNLETRRLFIILKLSNFNFSSIFLLLLCRATIENAVISHRSPVLLSRQPERGSQEEEKLKINKKLDAIYVELDVTSTTRKSLTKIK